MKKYILLVVLLMAILVGCGQADAVDDLLAYKGTLIGDASAVGGILSLLEVDHDGFSLKTGAEPYGLELELNEVLSEDDMNNVSAYLMALVENMSYIDFIYEGETTSLDRSHIETVYEVDLRSLTDDKAAFLDALNP